MKYIYKYKRIKHRIEKKNNNGLIKRLDGESGSVIANECCGSETSKQVNKVDVYVFS